MVHVNSCCCGCTLRTGSVITSIWELILALITLGVGIWGLSLTESVDLDNTLDEEVHVAVFFVRTVSTIAILVGIVSGFFAGLLFIGTVKKRPSLVHAWKVFAIVWVVLSCVGIFISLTNGAPPKDGLTILLVLLKVYCIIVVHSYHHDLTSPTESSPPPPAYTSVGYIPAKGEVV